MESFQLEESLGPLIHLLKETDPVSSSHYFISFLFLSDAQLISSPRKICKVSKALIWRKPFIFIPEPKAPIPPLGSEWDARWVTFLLAIDKLIPCS